MITLKTLPGLAFCPRLYVLNDPQITSNCGAADFIQTSIMVGKQIIMRNWKNPGEPSFQEWSTELAKVASYEKISFNINDRTEQYVAKWGKYVQYIAIRWERGAYCKNVKLIHVCFSILLIFYYYFTFSFSFNYFYPIFITFFGLIFMFFFKNVTSLRNNW